MGKKKPTFFTQRGEKVVPIQLADWDDSVDVTINVPTNKEHNELMEQFTDITPSGTADIRMAEFAEEQMVRFIVDLPFDIPTNFEMTEFKKWENASEDEKRFAINCMDTNLHDAISKAIIGITNLSEADKGN